MEAITLAQLLEAVHGTLLGDFRDENVIVQRVDTDSRTIHSGSLFIPLVGERFDGHAYINAALEGGALGCLTARERESYRPDRFYIKVASTQRALRDLAAWYKARFPIPFIAVTGSVGKTTTKDMIAAVLSTRYRVLKTEGNYNNNIGLPLTLLRLDRSCEICVLEMGMDRPGEIDYLGEIVQPDVGVITNIGDAHIERLGSRENIARAKSELFEALPAGVGRAFANLDDDFATFMAERGRLSERSVALSGFAGHPDAALRGALERESAACDQAVWAEDVSLDAEGRPRFTLCARDAADHDDGALFATVERVPCALSLTGAHNVDNACAAASVGFALGLDLATIAAALGASVPEPGRQEIIAARGGFTVINDAYNASPDSMRASLATFAATDVAGRRIAVLGDMGELGSFAPACHEGVGAAAASHHLDKLICIGELARHIAAGAEAAGMDAARISRADTVADVLEELDALLEPGDAVLVKASHFMGLTRIVEGLVN